MKYPENDLKKVIYVHRRNINKPKPPPCVQGYNLWNCKLIPDEGTEGIAHNGTNTIEKEISRTKDQLATRWKIYIYTEEKTLGCWIILNRFTA